MTFRRPVAAAVLAAPSAPLFWRAAGPIQDTWTCRRGQEDECLIGFVQYAVIGIPALVVACGLLLAGLLICLPARRRKTAAWGSATAFVAAVALLSIVLWNK